jgi:outer membrane protein OmpA-like peptidoglycan-associated protein
MSEDHDHEAEERRRVQRRKPGAAQPGPSADHAPGPETPAPYPGRLVGDPRLGGRGNTPVRSAVMQRAQQTHGNRAVQRAVRGGGPVPVQRDGPGAGTLPPVPDFQLTPPSLLQAPDPAARYRLGGDQHLHLDPEIQAMAAQYVQQQLDPAGLRTALAGVRLGSPAAPGGAGSGTSAPAATAPTPTPTAAPLVPAGAGPATPHAAGAGDLMSAVLAVPAIDQAITTLQTQALQQLSTDWGRLGTGERIGVVSTVAVIGLGALGGAMTDPQARDFLLGQLNGRVLPVPGVNWLHLEVNTGGNNLMFGMHVDVGALLPPSLGFGPGSPQAIGGPPQPEPFVPGQRMIQRSAGAGAPAADTTLAQRIDAAAGRGSRLDAPVQRQLEAGLGADLSGVRVHTGSEADHLARSVDAVAFTTGADIFFRSGAYNPATPDGLHLLAHEATHTVQQAAGPVAGTPAAGGVAISDPSDSFEQAAEQTAAGVVAGMNQAAAPAADSAAPVQRQADPNRAGAALGGLRSRGPTVVQRSLTGSFPTADGGFEVGMITREDAGTGSGTGRSGLEGDIKFIPSKTAPYSNKIGLIQIVKLTDAGGANVEPASLPTARAPRLRTAEDALTGVEKGFFTDVLHNDFGNTNKDAPERSALPPHYAGGTPIFGFKRSEDPADIKNAELHDFPSTDNTTSSLDFSFETVARGDDVIHTYGAVKWAFGLRAGKVVNEKISVHDGESATFNAAMDKHRDFYTHEPVTFYFDFDSDVLAPTEIDKIDTFLDYLTRNADVRLTATGFADHRGDPGYNRRLARNRAEAVAQALLTKGVDAARINPTATRGATEDFTQDAVTDQDRDANRRGNRNVTLTFERVAIVPPAPAPGPAPAGP